MRRLTLLSIVWSVTAAAQSTPIATFPFHIESGLAFVDATVNGVAVSIAMDTGAPGIILDASLIPSARINVVQPIKSDGIGIGQIDSLRAGSLLLKNQQVWLRSFAAVNDSASGRPPVVGVIGTAFFRQFVTRIDFADHVVTLYDPATFTYNGPGISVPVTFKLDLPQVDAVVSLAGARKLTARLIIDLGSSSSQIALTTAYARSSGLTRSSDRYIEIAGVTSLYGNSVGRLQRVDSVKLGGLEIVGPIANISDALGAAIPASIADGTVGMPVLRRTTMILDYRRSRIIFEKNSEYSAPYEFTNVSGLQLERAGSVVRVRNVIAGSPAADSGILIGDELISVDDQPVPTTGSLNLPALRDPGTTHDISIRRGDKTLRVSIALRRLI
ncbi:MAG TPA: PDZ domain-containing protein [Gemmatimonadaceae bacterium]|nr:PDZ domain-containing protein [Gemmatimonadaceae bacterium]